MDFEQAASYWETQDAQARQMEPAALKAEMESFIAAHNTCALATGCGDFIRCTPIEYHYRNGAFWMFSEGGLKFRALAENRKVCLAIYDAYTGFDHLGGMQVSGTAELTELWSAEYLELLAVKKIPPDSLRRLNRPLHLIKVVPARIDFLSSAFQQRGFSPRQLIVF